MHTPNSCPYSCFLGLPSLWAGSIIPSEVQEEVPKASLHIRGLVDGRRGRLCATGGQAAPVPLRLPSWTDRGAELSTLQAGGPLPTHTAVTELRVSRGQLHPHTRELSHHWRCLAMGCADPKVVKENKWVSHKDFRKEVSSWGRGLDFKSLLPKFSY